MKKLIVFLLLVLIAIPSFAAYNCIKKYDFTSPVASCSSLCENPPIKPGSYNFVYGIGTLNNQGGSSNQSNYSIPQYCTCAYDTPNNNGNPSAGYIICTYRITSNQISLTMTTPMPKSTSIPDALMSLATFSGNGASLNIGGPAQIIFNGLYTVYTNVESSITATFALLLLTIVTGWNLGISIFSRFLKKLENEGASWVNMTSTFWKGKAMMVIPAAVFFSLPVPINSPMLKAAGIGINTSNTSNYSANGNGCNVLSSEERKDKDTMKNIQTQINNDNSELRTLEQQYQAAKESNNTAEEGQLISQIQQLQSQIQQLQTEYNILNQDLNQIAQEQQMCTSTLSQSSYHFMPANQIRVPLAITMVRGFIMTGMHWGDTVANMAGGFIESYVANKIGQANAIVTNENNAMQQQLQADIQNAQNSLKQINTEGCFSQGAGGSSGSNITDICTAYALFPYYQQQININSNPQCIIFYHTVSHLCTYLNKQIRSLAKLNQEQQKTKQTVNQLEQQIQQTMNPLRQSLGILYPAAIPFTASYGIIDSFSSVQQYEQSAHLVNETDYGSSSPSTLQKATHITGSIFDKLVGYAKDIYSAVIDIHRIITAHNNEVPGHISLNPQFMFTVGQIIVIDSFPPGSMIAHHVSSLFQSVGNIATVLVGAVVGAVAGAITTISGGGPMVGIVIDGITSTITAIIMHIATGLLVLYSYFVAYGYAMVILRILPFLVVSYALMVRFLGYFLETLKLVLSLPFFGVAVATERPGTFSEFFKALVRLTMIPVVLAFTPLVSFTVIELVYYLLYNIPTMIALKSIAPNYLGYFSAGVVSAFLYLIASYAAILIAWEVTFGFVDGVFEYLQQFGLPRTNSTSIVQTIRGAVDRRIGSGLAG